MVMSNHFIKFHKDLISSSWVFLLRDRQTDRDRHGCNNLHESITVTDSIWLILLLYCLAKCSALQIVSLLVFYLRRNKQTDRHRWNYNLLSGGNYRISRPVRCRWERCWWTTRASTGTSGRCWTGPRRRRRESACWRRPECTGCASRRYLSRSAPRFAPSTVNQPHTGALVAVR